MVVLNRVESDLHSTMYLFKPAISIDISAAWFDLHSTMYLFKPVEDEAVAAVSDHLHSTMYLFKRLLFLSKFRRLIFTFHHVSI